MSEQQTTDDVRCPKCKSAKIHAEKRGFSIWIGFYGSGKIVVTCLACGHKFAPGQGLNVVPLPALPPVKPKATRRDDDDDGSVPTYKLD